LDPKEGYTTSVNTPSGQDLIVVANRLPVSRVVEGANVQWETSPGGLVSAVGPAQTNRRCIWVGWPGDSDPAAPFDRDGIRYVPVGIDEREIEDYYEGFSNGTLWPLYHDAVRPPEFRPSWWKTYEKINQRFADVVADAADQNAMVWVHDYQLQLVPAMLRKVRPDLRIGFFLHISFPPQELFMQLPWRQQIVEGILGADVVGFQVPIAARNFAVLARRLTGAQGRTSPLTYQGRDVRVEAFPISIDVRQFEEIGNRPETLRRAEEIRDSLGGPEVLLLGVDRLDYTKGITARLVAYKELLEEGQLSVPEAVMVQIAVPTRSNVPAYIEQRNEIERLIGELNGDFGRMGAPAVHYLHQSLDIEELVALYVAADVLVVTPYRDGMNLVAKEYVAARPTAGGIVLSEFAGAALSMPSAYLINPHDLQQMKESICRAINATPRDRERRWRSLRNGVFAWTNNDWADAFLRSLAGAT
jgi:trehalose 6-phosphate synthase